MELKKYCIKVTSVIFAAVLFLQFTVSPLPSKNPGMIAFADESEDYLYQNDSADGYTDYIGDHLSSANPGKPIDFSLVDARMLNSQVSFTEYGGIDTAIVWEDGEGQIDFQFSVNEDSLYSVKMLYRPLDENISEINLGIKLDGQYPCSAFNDIFFPSFWKDENNKFSLDSFGNELTPKQIMADGFFSRVAQDKTGTVTRPYALFVPAGRHILSICGKGDGAVIGGVQLIPYCDIAEYKDLVNKPKPNENNNTLITIQGEHPIKKSSRSLLPMADTLDSRITPNSKSVSLLNYIGADSWKYAGDELVYTFEVPKADYYKIGFMYKQSVNINRNSYRKLMIDGQVPFAEAESIAFEYSASWKFKSFSLDNGSDYLFWLDAGKHELSLEVTLGETEASFCRRMTDIADNLNALYLEIIKITGASPDLNRDYELFKQIPDFNKILGENEDALSKLIVDMEKSEGSGEIAASLKNMKRVLEKMISRPYRAHDYVSSFYSAYSQISSWLFDMKKMPLSIDEIQLAAQNRGFDEKSANFFKNISYRISRFLYSFVSDYNSVSGDSEDDKELLLWVTWGKDQASALDVMIKNDFTPKTGIKVNLKIVGASLVNGLISGKYPDLLLNVSRTEPVNLGMRGALYDLKKFDDFDEVLTRFQKGSETPFIYNNACYAIPDTQQFCVMLYRKDTLKTLGVDVPKTWEEFRNVAALIQRNNMEVYIPYTQITTNTSVIQGIGIMNLFPTLLKQSGLSLYSKDKRSTALNDDDVIDVFENWTKMYTDYQFVKESDFYNRFRMGIMPIGIAPYSVYFTIKEMAPEVQGKWSLALVPGTGDNNTITGGGSGCSIVNRSSKKEYAWEFLKWWTSADTQFEYSNRVESILGLVGRITTSNVEALKRMEWDKGQLDIILDQWSKVDELEEIPGSYYMIRSVDQAYWSVINGEMNAKDALSYWSSSADDEIKRKYREYGNR